MKRMLWMLAVMGVIGMGLVGCRAEGEIDVEHAMPVRVAE